ncbi:MAG: MoxR family ATPase [Anaerolineales bacterium]|nr:MoxR family ATPase [Anaerolineales bacterium]
MKEVKIFTDVLIKNIERVIVGKREVIELAIISLLSQGHLLIDDVPGVGKTMLARSLAHSLGCSFGRIQFTPDMLPSDVTGVSIYNQVKSEFEFRPGPIFSEIVLADEINRATPKTQSALLEAMQESQVTVDGKTHHLPPLFMVLATQNPIEYEGTFRLPEAQLDRFLMRIQLGYPNMENELDILDRQQYQHPINEIKPVVSLEHVRNAQEKIRSVEVAPSVKRYIVEIVRKTRSHSDAYLGASPRGSLGLYRASQARAAIFGRDYVLPDDIQVLAGPVLGHRMILAPGAHLQDLDERKVLDEIIDRITVPGNEASLD